MRAAKIQVLLARKVDVNGLFLEYKPDRTPHAVFLLHRVITAHGSAAGIRIRRDDTINIVVVFPAPFKADKPEDFALNTSKLMASTAVTLPNACLGYVRQELASCRCRA